MSREGAPSLLEPTTERTSDGPLRSDVVIAGAGLGGLAAAIQLARAGLSVVCVEPLPFPHAKVGESFDWSAPRLLASLGLSARQLVDEGMAVYKKGIRVEALGRSPWDAQPAPWFARKPFEFETITVNVDRVRFDQRLLDLAVDAAVTFVQDSVSELRTEGERIVSCRTASGRTLEGAWFIDASGQARLFARRFGISKKDYGRKKVCLWTYFATAPYSQRTTFFGDQSDEYLTWIWDIPITADVTSVGCVMTASKVREQRQKGQDARNILAGELRKHARFAELLADQPDFPVRAMAYRSYVHAKVCGPNWLMVGESASLPDPATANGVTAALRHARAAATYILQATTDELSARQRLVYDTNVRRLGHVFNHSIETAVYGDTIRRGFGGFVAQRVYTAFSYVVNALYSRMRPESEVRMAAFGFLVKLVWVWMVLWSLAGRIALCARRAGGARHRAAPSRPVAPG